RARTADRERETRPSWPTRRSQRSPRQAAEGAAPSGRAERPCAEPSPATRYRGSPSGRLPDLCALRDEEALLRVECHGNRIADIPCTSRQFERFDGLAGFKPDLKLRELAEIHGRADAPQGVAG